MALTVSLTGDWMSSVGNRRAVDGTITFDSSYATGGESLTAANIGLGTIDHIQFNQGEDGYVFEWDKTNNTVIVYSPQLEVASSGAIGSNMEIGLSADAGTATLEGGTGVTGARSVQAGATLGQVTAATNLSAVVVEFHAVGR